MLWRLFVASAALALTSTHTQANAAACTGLYDRNSKFVQSIKSMTEVDDATFNKLPIAQVLQPLHDFVPWLSSCVATIDPNQVPDLFMNKADSTKCSQALTDPFDNGYGEDLFTQNYCPFFNNTIKPCVNSVVLATVDQLIAESGGCCDAFKSQMVSLFGTNLDHLVNDLLRLLANTLCSTIHTDTGSGSCGMRYANISNFEDPALLSKLLMVPSGQACNAITGKPFTFTNGSMSAKIPALDACYVPIDDLFTYIKELPFMTTLQGQGLDLLDFFATGDSKCLTMNSFVSWLSNPSSLFHKILHMVDGMHKAVLDFMTSSSGSFLASMFEDDGNHDGSFGAFNWTGGSWGGSWGGGSGFNWTQGGSWGGGSGFNWTQGGSWGGGSWNGSWMGSANDDGSEMNPLDLLFGVGNAFSPNLPYTGSAAFDPSQNLTNNTQAILKMYNTSNPLGKVCMHVASGVQSCSFTGTISLFDTGNTTTTASLLASSANNLPVNTFMLTTAAMLVLTMTSN